MSGCNHIGRRHPAWPIKPKHKPPNPTPTPIQPKKKYRHRPNKRSISCSKCCSRIIRDSDIHVKSHIDPINDCIVCSECIAKNKCDCEDCIDDRTHSSSGINVELPELIIKKYEFTSLF